MSELEEDKGKEARENIIEMDVERLRNFKDHPYKVEADLQMVELKESISHYGILNPLIVRPLLDGCYEIISGHRRKFAAEQLGYRKVPVIIRVLKDDDAVLAMVDSNIQREFISPSEKAFAYKMKYDVMKRRSGRRKTGQVDHNLRGKRTIEILGEQFGDSPKQVQRYLKITELIPELLKKLDYGEVSLNPAVELAFLKEEEQKQIIEAMDYTQAVPSLSQAQRMKELSYENKLSLEEMQNILGEVKKGDVTRVIFKNEQLYKFFPKNYTPERMKREIIAILKVWMENYWTEE